jgi:hypothetical protein
MTNDPDEMRYYNARVPAARRRRARERFDGDPWFECEPPEPPEEIQTKFDRVERLRLLALVAFKDDDTEVGDALLDRAADLVADAEREYNDWLHPDPF